MRFRGAAFFAILGLASHCGAAGGPLPTPPARWTLEVVAEAPVVRHPSVVCSAPDGRVFVAEDPMDISLPSADAARGRILCIHPDRRVTVFADDLHAVFGMQYLDGRLYVLHNPKFTVFRDDGSGVGRDRRNLIESTNPNPWALNWNDHVPANFRLAMDGYFYVAVGDKGVYGAVGTDGKRVDLQGGGVLRVRPDGTGLEVYCTGVRNILDVALNDEDEMFTYDNTDEHNWMGRLTHMVDGGFYGYPYDFIPRRPYTLWMMADYGAGAATGALAYNESALPAEYHGNLFLADFAKRNVLRVRVEREGATYKALSRQDLFTDVPPDFRPVGIALAPDGLGLYICDWQHVDTKEKVEVGRLLKLTYVGTSDATPKPGWYVPAASGRPFEASTSVLVESLSHASHEVRTAAQRRLVDRGAAAVAALRHLLEDSGATGRARVHAMWALHGIDGGGSASEPISKLATDTSPMVRRQTLRLMGARRDAGALHGVKERLKDPDASVRFYAAAALGRIGDTSVVPALVEGLADPDDWTRYATFTALSRIGRRDSDVWATLAEGLRSSDERVRHGCAFAMRETFDARLVDAVAAVAGDRSAAPAARAAAVSVLGPLHHKPTEWKGEWWAYHPALGRPPRRTIKWEGTAAVLAMLRQALDAPDAGVTIAALDALRDAGDRGAAEAIRRVGDRPGHELRRAALLALATCDDGRSVPFLTAELKSPLGNGSLDAIVLETLGRLKATDAVDTIKDKVTSSPPIRAAAFNALVLLGGEAARGAIGDLMEHPSADVRRSAARAAGELADRSLIPKLLSAYGKRDTREAAIAALARMPDVRAVDAYLEGLSPGDFALREKCRQALREVRDAALPAVEAAAEKSLSDDVVLELRQVYNDHEKALRGPLFARQISSRHPEEYMAHALSHAGESRRGEKLFAATTAGGLGCVTCHVVGGQGGTVGPDLSGIGAKYSRRDLADGVLYPSKAVREGYQQVIVRTRAGLTYSGPVKSDTPDELTIHEADGTLRRVRKDDIAARKDSGLSPMPEGLHAGLTPQQFTDLVSYLESLKSSDAPAPEAKSSPEESQ